MQTFILKTQKKREKAVERLEKWIEKAERAVEKTEDENIQREWIKLAGFLHQILNGLLKAYDETGFNEDLRTAQKLLEQLKRKQEELELRERNLKLKEEELARKLEALQKARGEGSV